MAEHAHTTTTSAARDDFDKALCNACIIADIIGRLAEGEINGTEQIGASLYSWLASELRALLERIEVADMTMRRTRA